MKTRIIETLKNHSLTIEAICCEVNCRSRRKVVDTIHALMIDDKVGCLTDRLTGQQIYFAK